MRCSCWRVRASGTCVGYVRRVRARASTYAETKPRARHSRHATAAMPRSASAPARTRPPARPFAPAPAARLLPVPDPVSVALPVRVPARVSKPGRRPSGNEGGESEVQARRSGSRNNSTITPRGKASNSGKKPVAGNAGKKKDAATSGAAATFVLVALPGGRLNPCNFIELDALLPTTRLHD